MEDKTYEYDLVIVGGGISGATIAALNKDKRVLVIERGQIGGLARTEDFNGTIVHKHGAHIFHTDDDYVWEFVNNHAIFNGYIHQEKALINDKVVPFPINIDTYNLYYDVSEPSDVNTCIESGLKNKESLEEYLSNVLGENLYNKYYKGYLTKYWGMQPKDLPWFLFNQEDIRSTYSSIAFKDRFQGVPIHGYTSMIEDMLSDADVIQADFLSDKEYYKSLAPVVIYTGSLDEYFNYGWGKLPYRSFIHRLSIEPVNDYQGCAVMRHCDEDVRVLNTTEHWFMDGENEENTTVVSRCYSRDYEDGKGYLRGRAYPLDKPQALWGKYMNKMMEEEGVYIAGHLAHYCDMTMAECVKDAMITNDIINDSI